MKKEQECFIKFYAITVSLITFVFSLYLYSLYNTANAEFQFVEKFAWIKSISVNYEVGIDGISLLLIVLTTFIFPLCIVASWNTIKDRIKLYYFLMLIMEAGLIGVFSSLDLLLFYFFWEFILIPMYFFIGIWGSENRIYATTKFFIYTMFGSVLLLIGIIWLGFIAKNFTNEFTVDFVSLQNIAPSIPVGKADFSIHSFYSWLSDKSTLVPVSHMAS